MDQEKQPVDLLDEILNRVSLLTNVSGTYRGIKYQWKPGGDHSVELNIWDRGENISSTERILAGTLL